MTWRYSPDLGKSAFIRPILGAMQMVDVHIPTTDGRHLVLSRYTQPDQDQKLLLQEMKLALPELLYLRLFHRQFPELSRV